MSSGGAGMPPQAGPGGAFPFPFIQVASDPSVSPGRKAPVGTRAFLATGTAAWDKAGVADTDWVPVGEGGGSGTINEIDSPEGSIDVANPTGPITDIDIALPGEGADPKPLGALYQGAGVTLRAALWDHQHPFPFTNSVNAGGSTLATFDATHYQRGALVWVESVGAWFVLQPSTLTADGIMVVNAFNLAGFQWLRVLARNPDWEAVTTWFVNTATGNDEAAGSSGAPLKTLTELARRLEAAEINNFITITVVGNMASTDLPYFTFRCVGLGFVTIQGTPTTLYTGTVTTYTASTPAPSTTDDELHDTGITGGSFTAAGLLATGVLGTTTTGGLRSFWFAKDLGSDTARISKPYDGTGDNTLTNGQGYKAQQLQTAQLMRFTETAAFTVEIVNFFFQTAAPFDPCILFDNCCFQVQFVGPLFYQNCAFQGSIFLYGSAESAGATGLSSGLVRGNGISEFTVVASIGFSTIATVTFQGSALQANDGTFINIENDIRVYDYTVADFSSCPITAVYWSFILFGDGAFAGSGNATLATAGWASQIAHLSNPAWVAGSASNPTPISPRGRAPISVASEGTGGGNIDSTQNGIYATA